MPANIRTLRIGTRFCSFIQIGWALRVHGRLETDRVDRFLDLLPHCVVDDLIHVGRLKLPQRFAHDVFHLSFTLDGSVKGLLMQGSPGRIALRIERLAVPAGPYPAPDAQPLATLLGHIVGRMMRDEKPVGDGLEVFGKSRPRLFEAGFRSFAPSVTLFVARVLRPTVVFVAADAGDDDRVEAVMRVVHALFPGIFLLQSPHPGGIRPWWCL